MPERLQSIESVESNGIGSGKAIRTYLTIIIKIAALIGLLLLVSHAGKWIVRELNPNFGSRTETQAYIIIIVTITIYIILMMLPFVPGIEVGLGIMVMFGPKIVPFVYVATVFALTLSFLAGRCFPKYVITRIFDKLKLTRAGNLVRKTESLDPKDRLRFLIQNVSNPLVPVLLRHRFLTLAIALNLPGNGLIGGGGGICLVAGLSRLFTFPKFAVTVIIAVSPVPLLIIFTGKRWVSG